MQLDVIIPTYNRQKLLERTLQSLRVARVPEGLTVKVTVVDNNSSDGTRALVERWKASFPDRLSYVFEPKQGRSHALNAGIDSSDGDLLGFIDDDAAEIDFNSQSCVQLEQRIEHLGKIRNEIIPGKTKL